MKHINLIERSSYERSRQEGLRCRIFCCSSPSCALAGAAAVRTALVAGAERHQGEVEVVGSGCQGLCSAGPLVRVEVPGEPQRRYSRLDPAEAHSLAADYAQPSAAVEARRLPDEMPFFARQLKIVLENIERHDPTSFDHYLASGGYQALAHALEEQTPTEVCEIITESGLRGRGGAGYPTGVKWNLVRKASAKVKYVIANGDEGDPGAYMDRTVMEDDPHRVIEGLLLAAYATGAQHGFLYVRGEYPLAIQRLTAAIHAARRAGLVGAEILGSTFSCTLEVRIGAGAFVCGEETALIASIEGQRGSPRVRPPYPPERGLHEHPTLINNVETLANVPAILRHGADWFAAIGTATSKGTKVFSLNGSLVHTGLIEVPMGITLREIVYEMGGGASDGRAIKAVQTGGPSGGCIPRSQFDLPVDYDSLAKAHSIMGSGGMIVVDDSVSMVDFAKYFMDFCRDESCGKCIPCRVGTVQLSRLLERIQSGQGTLDDLERLEELSEMVQHTSLCGLGQTAPNPVLSTLTHFRDEYLARVGDRRRPRNPHDLSHLIVTGGAGSHHG